MILQASPILAYGGGFLQPLNHPNPYSTHTLACLVTTTQSNHFTDALDTISSLFTKVLKFV